MFIKFLSRLELISMAKVSAIGVIASLAVFSVSPSAPPMIVVSSWVSSPPFPASFPCKSTKVFSSARRNNALCLFPSKRSNSLLIGYAMGKQIQTRTRTRGATAAPIAKPYREQTACGIISPNKSISVTERRIAPHAATKLSRNIGRASIAAALHIKRVQSNKCCLWTTDTFFGPGTVDNVKCHIHAIESEQGEIDGVFVNAILSAIQQRNLERAWEKPVLDRVGLIIEIFNAHAYTKEAKLQAELAAIMYKKSRLVRVRASDGRYTFGTRGEAEVVSARGRGSGGRGFISGAGETELELQRRRISERRKRLLAEIEDVRKTRAVQRAGRRKQGVLDAPGLATVAVVGYTNAGKSTLVSALSDSDLYSDDRLFATVDPRVRGVSLPSGRKVLLSDTVGFISDLPVQLIEAFHATLEEVVEADLLVHVLDSSALNLEEQRQAVLDVLQQIGVPGKKIEDMVEVWNKIDLHRDVDTDTGVENFNDDNDYRFVEDEAEIADKQLQEDEENQHSDTSIDWLGSTNDNEEEKEQLCSSKIWTGEDDQKIETLNESRLKEDGTDTHSESKLIPHVKTSAVAGVGLQELLVLIDNKLVQIDKEQHSSRRVLEKSEFDRKWRPIQAENVGVAVE